MSSSSSRTKELPPTRPSGSHLVVGHGGGLQGEPQHAAGDETYRIGLGNSLYSSDSQHCGHGRGQHLAQLGSSRHHPLDLKMRTLKSVTGVLKLILWNGNQAFQYKMSEQQVKEFEGRH